MRSAEMMLSKDDVCAYNEKEIDDEGLYIYYMGNWPSGRPLPSRMPSSRREVKSSSSSSSSRAGL
jgi:hypothetical protein